MENISFVVPQPPRACSPNSRVNHFALARAKKHYKGTVMALAFEALSGRQAPRWRAATVRLCWMFPVQRRRDRDNLIASFKAGLDGLVAVGILADDDMVDIQVESLRSPPNAAPSIAISVYPKDVDAVA